jgi:peptidoglycan/LPS O-acetylase OafA/YrhL
MWRVTASETELEPRLLPRLTAFRWYAALVVCLYHLGGVINWQVLSPFSIGTVGVSFFYVLSGFVLTWSYRSDPDLWRFYRRRFARIYPATIVTGVVAAVLVAAGLITTLVLVRTGHGYSIAYTNPLVRLPGFVIGVGLGVLVVRGWRPSFPLWAALLLVAAGAEVARHWPLPVPLPLNDYVLLPGIVALLLSGIGSDLRGRHGPLTARVSVYLGELSFCFYLVHLLVLDAVVHAVGWSGERFSLVGSLFAAAVVVGAGIAAAAALHHLVELPMQRVLRPARRPCADVATGA